jgi:hypothetical protein
MKSVRRILAVLILVAMAALLGGCVPDLAELGQATDPVIYGNDDRKDIYQVIQLGDPKYLAWYPSTGGLVSAGTVDCTAEPCVLTTSSYKDDYLLCEGEPFYDQVTAPWCSAFLVAPDRIATAGHCIVSDADCAATKFVFTFELETLNRNPALVSSANVFQCTTLWARRQTSTNDFSVVQLDRPVTATNRPPLAIRRTSKVPNAAALVVIGHPSGLPKKVANGAVVKDNNPTYYFQANVDTYGGNSGSAVFGYDTQQVEGILVRGNQDYVWTGSCYVSNRCLDTGCSGSWEESTRIAQIAPFVAHASCTEYRGTASSTWYQTIGAQPAGRTLWAGLEWGSEATDLDLYLEVYYNNKSFRWKVSKYSGTARAHVLRQCAN